MLDVHVNLRGVARPIAGGVAPREGAPQPEPGPPGALVRGTSASMGVWISSQ